ncbi:peptidylprolyl isomerase [Rufibacter roseus]|uniref:peptidylprolyl isomerase n=1 Tax=Rufibacter roseus TaxID=1567108 RepID=A0ABW2DHS5_9BACT|nr:peptidylprolyl isomerase [Rufibacter roseus]
MKKRFRSAAALLLIAAACSQPGQKSSSGTGNKFSDATIRNIYTLQDERKTEGLLPFLQRPEAMYRREAALAFASVQDTAAVSALTPLLQDPEAEVQKAAAYALGQIGKSSAEQALIAAYGSITNPAVRAEILEVWGKVATQRGLDMLSMISSGDSELQRGQAWALYRAGQRKLNYGAALKKASNLLSAKDEATRLGAAHFLGRTPNLDVSALKQPLFTVVRQDPSAHVRMAAVLALGKMTDTSGVAPVITQVLRNDTDYRVRVNAVRPLHNLAYAQVKDAAFAALSDKHPHVALAAAEYLTAKAPASESGRLLEEANKQSKWRVRAALFGAALATAPSAQKSAVAQQIQQRYTTSKDPYEKAALLTALSKDQNQFKFIQEQVFTAKDPVIGTTGLETLASIRGRKDFNQANAAEFSNIFKRAVESGDVALVGIGAGAIRNPDLGMRFSFPDKSFLTQARDKLTLPRDVETHIELQKTIDYLEGKPESPVAKTPFSHPINWATVNSLSKDQKALLRTSKGDITLQLYVEDAPGSVANFVELVKKGFYDGKNFHRVVPNFVVQGGDPRGDGWGSSDYAIRSEFPNLHYLEGTLGMASAGKDTESVQWFITHSPTPHLDGRYSIFAHVIKGMDVVHQLEIGDKIEKVTLVK